MDALMERRLLLTLQPPTNVFSKLGGVVKLVEVLVDLVPVYVHVPGGQYIPKSSERGQPPGKVVRHDSHLALEADRLVVILWLGTVFERNDSTGDVDATLCDDFKVSLGNIPEVGILLEVTLRLFLKSP